MLFLELYEGILESLVSKRFKLKRNFLWGWVRIAAGCDRMTMVGCGGKKFHSPGVWCESKSWKDRDWRFKKIHFIPDYNGSPTRCL